MNRDAYDDEPTMCPECSGTGDATPFPGPCRACRGTGIADFAEHEKQARIEAIIDELAFRPSISPRDATRRRP